ncbi:MAG: DNA polymerase-2 [Paraglaciecola sp.]|jgi:DNA polymerase-2
MYFVTPTWLGPWVPDIPCGFILTRHQREMGGCTYLEYWLVTDAGPVKLTTPAQRTVFFVRQQDQTLITGLFSKGRIDYEFKALDLVSFAQEPIGALYFHRSSAAYKAKQALQQANIICFEDDIRLSERFLMERFVYGSAAFSGLPQHTQGYQSYHQAQLKPADYIPGFKVLSLDIECSEHGELYSIGLAASDYQQVLMIGEPVGGNTPDWIKWVADEKALLLGLLEAVKDYDPDLFIGWNVVNFDFRLLIKRAQLHKVALTLGRGKEPLIWRDARGEVNQGFVSMPGRLVIDGIDALKTATYHFDSFSLESVARALLGKGKLSDDVDNRMAAINHDFKHNKVKLAQYNLQDCTLVLNIFAHTKVLDFLTLRSQLTGLELDRAGGSVAAFINLYLPKLHRAGYVSPNRPGDGGLASPGGYVMNSRPGLYRQVLVLDFKSLYPSIIRTFKIDPLGLIEGLKSPHEAIPGYKGALFSRDKHFLPEIITSLWQQRDEAKLNKDAARSQAIKILMNSFYGVLGSGGCPFYDTRLASSITMRGHDIMQTTAKWITAAGYQVIYGDTDSTFVWLEGEINDQQAQNIGKALEQDINQRWTALVEQEYQLENHLEIEFETHFSQFLMPTIRGSEQGSKKRYAGIKKTNKDEELIFKGLETVRSDWTVLAKTFQHKLYTMVFAKQDVKAYLRQIIADTLAGHFDQDLVYRKRLRRQLSHYVKNVPPHVKAARLADQINQTQGKSLRYQHKGWVSYVITLNGPEPIEYLNSKIDYEHYIDKQIRPIAEGILPFIGLSFTELTSSQLGLF